MILDKEEKELLDDYEARKMTLRKPTKKDLQLAKSAAAKTLRKDHRVTIRLYEHDFLGIQHKAVELGLPYQTLISSLIHRFVEGDFKFRAS